MVWPWPPARFDLVSWAPRGVGDSTALLNPSAGANRLEGRYFIRGTLPRAGTRCQQDGVLLPG